MAVLIVAIVFSFTAFSAYLDYNRKKDKEKINAALRMEEMRRGYRPGTYSSYSSSRNIKKINIITMMKMMILYQNLILKKTLLVQEAKKELI
jgi:hypothetical protein